MGETGGFFERTPKFGIVGRAALPLQAVLYRQKNLPYLLLNGILFCYSLLPIAFAWQRGMWYALPRFAIFPAGFLLLISQEAREVCAWFRTQAGIAFRPLPGRFLHPQARSNLSNFRKSPSRFTSMMLLWSPYWKFVVVERVICYFPENRGNDLFDREINGGAASILEMISFRNFPLVQGKSL